MSDAGKTIRFIDARYKELFRIPDGGSIKITYPTGDGRGTISCQCKHLDETHVEIGGSDGSYRNTYHICEFAERMEEIGARYEPEEQLRNVEILPFSQGDERFYAYNREAGNSCVGHIAGDFGNNGDRYYSTWYNNSTRSDDDWRGCTFSFQEELYRAVYALRQDLLMDYSHMLTYCLNHPEAMIDRGNRYIKYGFKLETAARQYYARCLFGEAIRDASFIIYVYDKPAPVPKQTQPAFGTVLSGTADESGMFYRNSKADNLCVGYLRGDHGRNGREFHDSWNGSGNGRNTPAFQAEIHYVIEMLKTEFLNDLKSTQDYCHKHPEARLPGETSHYGFKVETESRQYFLRCTTLQDDCFYVFAYDKEQQKPACRHQDEHEHHKEAKSI